MTSREGAAARRAWDVRAITDLRRVIDSAVVAFAAIALAVMAGVGLWITFSDIPIIGAAEPNVIYTIQKRLAGMPLYGDPDQIPFDVTQYTPLFYVLASAPSLLLNIAAEDAVTVWRVSRLAAWFVSLAFLATLYVFLTRTLAVGRGLSVVAMAYAFVALCPYQFYARPDTLLALTTLVSLASTLTALQREGRAAHRWAATGAVAAFLAIASKQSGIVVLPIIAGALILSRRYKLLATAAGTLLGCTAMSAAVLYATGAMPPFVANVIWGLELEIRPYHALMNVFIPYVRTEIVLIAVAGLYVAVWMTGGRSPAAILFAVALPMLFGFAAVTSLKDGSGGNYYNEFTVLAVAATAYGAEQVRVRYGNPLSAKLLFPLSVIALVIVPVRTIDNTYRFTYGRSEPGSLRPQRGAQLAAYDELASYLRDNTNPARGEYIVTFDRGLMTVLPLHTITPQTERAASRYWQGISRMDAFRSLVIAGRVKYVVFLKGQVWPDLLGVAVDEQFEFLKEYPEQLLYRHRSITTSRP